MNWLTAEITCLAAAGIESLLAGQGRLDFLRTLHQPKWALPLPVLIAAALLFYTTMVVALGRLLIDGLAAWLPITLIISMLAVDIAVNTTTFRLKDFGQALWLHLPYGMIVVAIALTSTHRDPTAATAVLLNLPLILYGFTWTGAIRKLNRSRTR